MTRRALLGVWLVALGGCERTTPKVTQATPIAVRVGELQSPHLQRFALEPSSARVGRIASAGEHVPRRDDRDRQVVVVEVRARLALNAVIHHQRDRRQERGDRQLSLGGARSLPGRDHRELGAALSRGADQRLHRLGQLDHVERRVRHRLVDRRPDQESVGPVMVNDARRTGRGPG